MSEGMLTEAAPPEPTIKLVELDNFIRMDLPPRELLLAPWLPRQGLAMIHAYRGIGKTHVALAVAYAVATGGNFLDWKAPAPAGVLYLDGEMPAPALQERLQNISASEADKTARTNLEVFTPDLQPKERPAFNLSEPDDQEQLEPLLKGVDLIVVDNLATLCRAPRTNDADSWMPVQEWALRQRGAGRSVLFIHHSGKSGNQRGTSAKEDVLDTVIGLKRPSDYEAKQGARFEIHFEKARGFAGEDSEPLEAILNANSENSYQWSWKPQEESLYERVIALRKDGLNQMEIAEEVGRNKSNISRMVKRAKEEGKLPA